MIFSTGVPIPKFIRNSEIPTRLIRPGPVAASSRFGCGNYLAREGLSTTSASHLSEWPETTPRTALNRYAVELPRSPSIVPESDQKIFLVRGLRLFGPSVAGNKFRRWHEAVITDVLEDTYTNPVRVIASIGPKARRLGSAVSYSNAARITGRAAAVS
jgi:hypothetical protein